MIVAAFAVVVPVGLLALTRGDGDPPPSTRAPIAAPSTPPFDPARAVVGAPAPDITLPTTEGGTFRLADLRGRPVVLNFFASWCRPCEEEMPALEALARDGRVGVVGVTYRDSPADARAFVKRLGVTFPTLIDDDTASAVARAYGVRSPPMTFFIDAGGRIGAPPVYGGIEPADLGPGLARIAPGVTPPS